MNVVVDASAMGAMLLPDEDQILGEFTGSVCLTAGLHVPPVWRAEVANLLLKAFRHGRIDDLQLRLASARADVFARLTTIGFATGIDELIDFAMSHALRAHDATYLHLAQTLRVPLLTNDTQMLRAAAASGVELLRP